MGEIISSYSFRYHSSITWCLDHLCYLLSIIEPTPELQNNQADCHDDWRNSNESKNVHPSTWSICPKFRRCWSASVNTSASLTYIIVWAIWHAAAVGIGSIALIGKLVIFIVSHIICSSNESEVFMILDNSLVYTIPRDKSFESRRTVRPAASIV